MGFLDFLSKTVGVDAGSQNLRLVYKNKLIFDETSELSIDPDTHKVTGYGDQSNHSEPNKILKPVNTVIADFHGFEHLLRGSLKRSLNEKGRLFPSSHIMYFSLPMLATEVDKRAYRDSAEHAGAKEVHMIRQPFSSAIGMNILFEKKDFVLIDFSASKLEITVFANSLPVAEGGIRIGTWKLRNALKNHLVRNHNIKPTSTEIELVLRSLFNKQGTHKIENKEIDVNELRDVLNPYFAIIEDQILETLEDASAHQNIDRIISNGFYLTGGGSKMDWVREKITLNGKMNITFSSNPFLDNINGVKKVIKRPEEYRKYLMV